MTISTGDRLRQCNSRIIKKWEERTYKEIRAAHHQSSLALRDSLPQYLDQVADALSVGVGAESTSRRLGITHGRDRAGSIHYTIDQLISEYHILRQVICEVLEEVAPLSNEEREIILSSIEQAVNDAATQFSDTLRDIQQTLSTLLAHDMRGPITVALTSAELILVQPGDSIHSLTAANRIIRGMERLDSMAQEILDGCRLRAGQALSLELKRFDLAAVLRQVVEEQSLVNGKRFVVGSVGSVLGYWNRNGLRRVLENLATNAVKFSYPESVITFVLQQTPLRVLLSVNNFGEAIPPDERDLIFEQFGRGRSAKGQAGWGLGLTVVKELVEAHFGTVRIESSEDKGTTFIIELPNDSRVICESSAISSIPSSLGPVD